MNQTQQTTTSLVRAAIEARRGSLFTSRSIAFATNLPLPLVSALMRRFADRGLITHAGLGPQLAKGGLRATLWQVADETPSPVARVEAEIAEAKARIVREGMAEAWERIQRTPKSRGGEGA